MCAYDKLVALVAMVMETIARSTDCRVVCVFLSPIPTDGGYAG
jgi:hypothetical protein